MEHSSGNGRRLVLGFDAGCMTCNELARRIEERVGERLEVRSLYDPQVDNWRIKAFGSRAPWAPTLIETDGVRRVRAWTGLRMTLRLAHVLGPATALRVLQDVLATRIADPGVSQAAPAYNEPMSPGIDRAQFLKRLGTGAVAAGVAASGLGALSSRASAASAIAGRQVANGFATAGERGHFDAAVKMLSRHLRVGDLGTLRISDDRLSAAIEAGAEQGIPRKVFRELVASLDAANEQIREGDLRGGSRLISPGIEITEQESGGGSTGGGVELRSCRGKSSRTLHWWGIRMKLNSCQARTLIYYCTIEAGALSLCNKIWVIPCRIAQILLLVQCATYQRAAAPGRGIVIDKSWGMRLPRVYSQ